MKFMGSKRRVAKEILPIILQDRRPDQYYVEPFVGGCNTFDKVDEPKIGIDSNPYLIAMWKEASRGWLPPQDITEKMYYDIRDNKSKYHPYLVGYVGFALSYGGKWFGGWCRDSAGKRDYVQEAHRNALKQFPKLKSAYFANMDYRAITFEYYPEPMIFYCDPPYAGSTEYNGEKFDHDAFWQWCRELSEFGHTVFISEYSAPDDFTCVWEKEVTSSLTQDTGAKRNTERLFTI